MTLSKQYVAGLFDGERTVCISKFRNETRLCIVIPNTHKGVISLLKKQFVGSVTTNYRHKKTHKPVYQFTIGSVDEMKRFLKYIKDYVVIKRKQVELGLKYLDFRYGQSKKNRYYLVSRYTYGGTRRIKSRALRKTVVRQELRMKKRMNQLNRRGVVGRNL